MHLATYLQRTLSTRRTLMRRLYTLHERYFWQTPFWRFAPPWPSNEAAAIRRNIEAVESDLRNLVQR